MKHKWKIGLFIMVLMLVGTACGAVNNKGEGTASGSESPASSSNATDPAASPSSPTTRMVKSEKGEIKIPAEPKRVIGLSVVYPEFLYALGVTPVAVQNYHEEFQSYLEQPFKDTVKMGIAKTPNFEMILDSEPDLILAPAWWSEKDYDQLSAIAPTVLLPQRDDWRDELRDIGEVLGKQDAAEKVIEDLKDKEAKAKARLDELVKDETVLYLRIMDNGIIINGPNIDRGHFIHNQLGLKPVDNYPQNESTLTVSLEVLPEYDADHIIVQLDDETKAELQEKYSHILNSSLWKNMKAVKANHVYMVGGKEWFNLGMAPLADSYAIDEVVSIFEGKQQ
ncbi:iron-siderophore ABC transporter substrate-binding protein [Paenibacillus gorillae]|uniref:ABC transporter substrate-binding protein n=1 Tax=Paenibacillus gorillae TaxID=1243662 RepID=UPI0004B9E1F3|nr:iron-siderophore ABC transporter substrate-binding protein [Paenibacillus gorillae]